MIEIRFHGRGGQGAVVASKIMANAAAAKEAYRLVSGMAESPVSIKPRQNSGAF